MKTKSGLTIDDIERWVDLVRELGFKKALEVQKAKLAFRKKNTK